MDLKKKSKTPKARLWVQIETVYATEGSREPER